MTDRHDTLDWKHRTRKASFWNLPLSRVGFLILAFVFLTGSTRGCGDMMRPATITCQDISLQVELGSCVPFKNSCNKSELWAGPPDYDGFELEPGEEVEAIFGHNPPFSLHTVRRLGETTRSICVRDDSPLFASLDVEFVYGLRAQYGLASIYLTVAAPLTVEATANPINVVLGETSQLVAAARGGIRPYFYSWIPTDSLDDNDIAAPIASPSITTEYSVIVTDSGGHEVISRVTVSVGTDLTVAAYPPEIRIGDASVLLATGYGGTPPYKFIWRPTNTLDDPERQNPTAVPTTTTTYEVIAYDSAEAIMTGATTVRVRPEVTVSAQPPNVLPGETTTLFASTRGGKPPFTFTWTPADTLDDPLRQDPVASPATATTYQVIARDSEGYATAGAVTVLVVNDDPPPTASFVFAVECCPRIELDASASTGHIVNYTWDLGWTSANPDRITTSPTTSFTIQEFNRGPITLTVTGSDGRTATTTQTF